MHFPVTNPQEHPLPCLPLSSTLQVPTYPQSAHGTQALPSHLSMSLQVSLSGHGLLLGQFPPFCQSRGSTQMSPKPRANLEGKRQYKHLHRHTPRSIHTGEYLNYSASGFGRSFYHL